MHSIETLIEAIIEYAIRVIDTTKHEGGKTRILAEQRAARKLLRVIFGRKPSPAELDFFQERVG